MPDRSLDNVRSTEVTLANEASCQTETDSRQSIAAPPSQHGAPDTVASAEAAHAADASVSAKQTPEGTRNAAEAEHDVETLFSRWHGGSPPAHTSPAHPPTAKKPAHSRYLAACHSPADTSCMVAHS